MQHYPASDHAVSAAPPRGHGLASALANHLRRERNRLADDWRTAILRQHRARTAHPLSTEMVKGLPVLIAGIAEYVEHPNGRLDIEVPIAREAMKLGLLRHNQGFSPEDVMSEYELLGRQLFRELCTLAESGDAPLGSRTIVAAAMRLFHAIVAIEHTTTAHFLSLANERAAEREDRLHAFNRTVSHEVKNRIGAVYAAGEMLADRDELSDDRQRHLAEIVTRNADEIAATVDNLLVLARLEEETPAHGHALLRDVVQRVLHRCRDSAGAASVHLEIVGTLPDIEVADEPWFLALMNYVRNAIKYRNPDVPARHVKISAAIEPRTDGLSELVIRVADNGIGVPAEKRDALFTRFFRAHRATHPGTGLGLSIVRETIQALGGRAWAEFPAEGSVFSFAVPLTSSQAIGALRAPREL